MRPDSNRSAARTRRTGSILVGLLSGLCLSPVAAQVDDDQLGAWYMYFWSTRLDDGRFGFQGDGQYRAWDLGGDLEQLLLRGGATYTPRSGGVTFTLGYANVTSGEFGGDDDTSGESRIYQEALLPQKVGPRVHLGHRFRFEQRWVENQDFRTRFRYALFVTIPVNDDRLRQGTISVVLSDELFINGQREIGDGREVELFDRNRLYGAIGYSFSDALRVQGGYMYQNTDEFGKGQLQLSLHHAF
ncbi:MAG TPA: DUF2490 domain-containing protein [Candidatus Polarisedimenticolaceae bacterium]|nr:DUF2490 domain-containing protein [Candidatus Polarisedimenticolaceae bacterium]